jgi:hypothetical protein
MEFNSQICTTREQSDRLLKLGVKAETADMTRNSGNKIDYEFPYVASLRFIITNKGAKFSDIEPAWSLDRLIEMLKTSETPEDYKVDFYVGLNRYDEIIALIQSLINIGTFNKEYLNNE